MVFLKAIEQELGNEIPVQNFFDLIVGTRLVPRSQILEQLIKTRSTGGIIALGLGVKRWTVDNCIATFKTLCVKAFTPRVPQSFQIFSQAVGKSRYKTKPLEDALKSALDSDTLLYGGCRSESSTPIRVAVTSTNVAGRNPVVLCNYNTEGERERCEY